MDLETLFVESRWNALKHLCEHDYSPLELADKLNTSISNISQQLRFLEMAGLVQKSRIQNRDKGKPRALFSLVGNYLYLVAVTKTIASKKLIFLSEHQQMILNIWLLENKELHYYLEKFYWKLEDQFRDLRAIAFDLLNKNLRALVIVESLEGREKKGVVKIAKGDATKEIDYTLFTEEEFTHRLQSSSDDIYALYDPKEIILNLKKKGGYKDGTKIK